VAEPTVHSPELRHTDVTSTPSTSISHALLDRALEILDRDPQEWSHANDLFMLSLYGGGNKHKIAAAFAGAQSQDKLYGRLMRDAKSRDAGGKDIPEVHPQIVAMRVFLAAWIDWDRLLAPLRLTDEEVSGSLGRASAKWRRKRVQMPEILRS
jgi:hypothetical protein